MQTGTVADRPSGTGGRGLRPLRDLHTATGAKALRPRPSRRVKSNQEPSPRIALLRYFRSHEYISCAGPSPTLTAPGASSLYSESARRRCVAPVYKTKPKRAQRQQRTGALAVKCDSDNGRGDGGKGMGKIRE